jgi:hypothetical protein
MPLPLYPLGQRPRYPLKRRLCGPQSQARHCQEEKNLLPLPGIRNMRQNTVFFNIWRNSQHSLITSMSISASTISSPADQSNIQLRHNGTCSEWMLLEQRKFSFTGDTDHGMSLHKTIKPCLKYLWGCITYRTSRHSYEVTSFYTHHEMGTKITIPVTSLCIRVYMTFLP